MDETGTVVASVAGGGIITWFVTRLLNSPDTARKELDVVRAEVALLRERTIRMESRIGSEGDVGTIMHILTEMRQENRETRAMIQAVLKRVGES
jgi:hypothetical protein